MTSTDPALSHSSRYPGSEPPGYGGFWLRFCATLIDSLLMGAITAPILYLLYGVEYWTAEPTSFSQGTADTLLTWVFPSVITVLFWMKKRATPGKMVFNLEVVDADTGTSVSTQRLIIRYLSYFVSIIPVGLGFFWVLFDKRKQGWHDKIAGTLVIRRPRA